MIPLPSPCTHLSGLGRRWWTLENDRPTPSGGIAVATPFTVVVYLLE